MRPGERAFLDRDVVDDVHAGDLDESGEPPRRDLVPVVEILGSTSGRLSLAVLLEMGVPVQVVDDPHGCVTLGAHRTQDGRLVIWMTDDEPKVPVLIEATASLGVVKVRLVEWVRP